METGGGGGGGLVVVPIHSQIHESGFCFVISRVTELTFAMSHSVSRNWVCVCGRGGGGLGFWFTVLAVFLVVCIPKMSRAFKKMEKDTYFATELNLVDLQFQSLLSLVLSDFYGVFSVLSFLIRLVSCLRPSPSAASFPEQRLMIEPIF